MMSAAEIEIEPKCKRCCASNYRRNGFVRGLQRYYCKDCGCNFTLTPARGKPEAMKSWAISMYAMGNASFGMIGRLFKVSRSTALRWVRAEAEQIPESEDTGGNAGGYAG